MHASCNLLVRYLSPNPSGPSMHTTGRCDDFDFLIFSFFLFSDFLFFLSVSFCFLPSAFCFSFCFSVPSRPTVAPCLFGCGPLFDSDLGAWYLESPRRLVPVSIGTGVMILVRAVRASCKSTVILGCLHLSFSLLSTRMSRRFQIRLNRSTSTSTRTSTEYGVLRFQRGSK